MTSNEFLTISFTESLSVTFARCQEQSRGVSEGFVISEMELLVTLINGFQPLSNVTLYFTL